MLTLLADVVRHPSFPAEEIERQRASRLAQLVQQRENPDAVANAVMAAALYGAAHPYGFTELGTEASNKAMTARRPAGVLVEELRRRTTRRWSCRASITDGGAPAAGREGVRRLAARARRRRPLPAPADDDGARW